MYLSNLLNVIKGTGIYCNNIEMCILEIAEMKDKFSMGGSSDSKGKKDKKKT